MRLTAFARLGVFALLAACAPVADGGMDPAMTAAGQPRQCFNIQQVRNFTHGRSDQVFLRVGADDVYELNTGGGCFEADFALRLAVIPDTAGASGSRLCTGDWARIVVPEGRPHRSICRALVRARLTAEEVAALPSRHRP